MRKLEITDMAAFDETDWCRQKDNLVAVLKTRRGEIFHFEQQGRMNIDLYVYAFPLGGEATITINARFFALTTRSMLILNPLHQLRFHRVSDDFECLFYFVTKEYIEHHGIQNAQARMFQWLVTFDAPVFDLTLDERDLMRNAALDIARKLERTDHHYYDQLVNNVIDKFYWESDNILYSIVNNRICEGDNSHTVKVLHEFVGLMMGNYRSQHYSEFYAGKLGMTPQYLNRILKQHTGRTATTLITSMLYNDARSLLSFTDMTIQQVADVLHFSDQTAFCKFFKRLAGGYTTKF